MRILIPNVITPEEAKILRDTGGFNSTSSRKTVAFNKIKETIKKNVAPDCINWDEPSKIRIERRRKGHEWHKDTGSSNHMLWCDYGASILLTDSDDAGYLEYRDGTKILPKEHYCSLALHSSDVEHRVEENKDRVTFLSFLQLNND